MDCIFEQKNALRKVTRKKLRELDPETARISDTAICKQVAKLPEFQQAETIFVFVGVGWEINTEALIQEALFKEKNVAVPLCVGPGIMEARFIRSLDELVPGAYDIPEPARHSPLCDIKTIDFAVVPCVTCDRFCKRLGQGGGFYDRFLENSTFKNAALCRDMALVDDVPVEPWDHAVDFVVTETRIFSSTNNVD